MFFKNEQNETGTLGKWEYKISCQKLSNGLDMQS